MQVRYALTAVPVWKTSQTHENFARTLYGDVLRDKKLWRGVFSYGNHAINIWDRERQTTAWRKSFSKRCLLFESKNTGAEKLSITGRNVTSKTVRHPRYDLNFAPNPLVQYWQQAFFPSTVRNRRCQCGAVRYLSALAFCLLLLVQSRHFDKKVDIGKATFTSKLCPSTEQPEIRLIIITL